MVIPTAAILIGVDGAFSGLMAGCPFQLGLLQWHDVTLQIRVVRQQAPRDGITVGAQAQKAAEFQRGITHQPGPFVDHQIINRPQLVTVRVVNRSALHFVGRNNETGHKKLLDVVQHIDTTSTCLNLIYRCFEPTGRSAHVPPICRRSSMNHPTNTARSNWANVQILRCTSSCSFLWRLFIDRNSTCSATKTPTRTARRGNKARIF